MYSIKVEADFSAAHNLRGYRGKCEELHGHNWKVAAVARKDNLDKIGMVLDFHYLKRELNKILERLDHKYLNRLAYFKKVNPTSENIAKYIYEHLQSEVSSIQSVTVWENNTSSVTYEA
ncbi:MAG: 6-carboxytetrahydropterin synthase QueD [Candidatus Omnitrophica bacterium]|nr:6-carboxytetrahydropterin synthase QueD [Candidatus Omnitrophota bacterium]MBU4345745.1 6-carboxytetrahydropterin synthase QueD [Candidatus Omnitrophota bacterium]MBU4472751.1 6-carboxytetrahydropterin synthase QueD [Candidatus Omnitrophota bacterium]